MTRNSIIKFNPDTREVDTKELCWSVCWFKYSILDRMDDIMNTPGYRCKDGERILVAVPCERHPTKSCEVEVICDKGI